ncbi:ABC transporter ATP-binding protein [Lacticaseibacillus saniviri]|uniref:YknV protein n=1 Tax=Lacticaseibacillus saniviri JCM 17471 = DSM 24301 TaxID=1293598 RepID=A0A0R2MUW0_9LACO|nr:ABC transporter ATP-binding protein [Lacticaseibacillus saniviri]KRO17301.1 YknV protein [Lacticaseibacillus saniviri JCM 17471 = DSM 24301]MCG4282404.1 ABC transporter ATP-binding protein/permease [Lacticaseibacillus saniviri]
MQSTLNRMLRFFWQQLSVAKGKLWAIIGTLVGVSVIQYFLPRITQIIIDQVIPKQEIGQLWFYIALALGLTIVLGGLNTISTYWIGQVSQTAISSLRDQLFSHTLKQDMAYFETSKTGDLMVVLTSDINMLQNLISANSLGLLGEMLSFVFVLIIMLANNWALTVMVLATFPLLFWTNFQYTKRIRAAYRKVRTSAGKMNNEIQETLTSVELIKSFATENQTEQDFNQLNVDNRDSQIEATKLGAVFSPVIDDINYLGTVIILGFGAWQVMQGAFTVGSIVAYLSYLAILQAPVRQLTSLIQRIQQAVVSYERIEALTATVPTITDPANPVDVAPFHQAVVLDQVDFNYSDDVPVLKNVSFELPHEKVIALVGSSGAGKTTITKLIERFYDVTSGKITFDGTDIKQMRLKDLRQQIGVVSQDVTLLDGTIRDNINYGSKATEDQIWQAAEAAKIADFIRSLPDGLDAQIGERGIRLSGGQKQRIAIARVFLKDAPILILDEATAALDNESERFIQQSFDRLMQERTSLVIAHRLSTIQNADEILVVEHGEIVERGTHAELLAKNGRYAELYEMQFK